MENHRKINININIEELKPYLLFMYAILIVSTFYHLYFAKRIIPGVKVSGVYLGGMTYNEAKSKLDSYEHSLTKELALEYEGDKYYIESTEIDLTYDIDASVTRSYEVGRNGNILIDTKDKIAGIVKGLYIPAIYDYDDDLLSTKFSQIKGEINIEERNASLSFIKNELIITPAQTGKKVVDDALYRIVMTSFDRMDFSQKTLPTKTIEPKVFESDIEFVFDDAKKIVNNKITIYNDKKTWVIDKDQLIGFLDYRKDTKENKITIELNKPRFEAFVDNLSYEVNVLPRGQVTEIDGDRVVKFEIIQDGLELDKDKFTEDFKEALFNIKARVDLPLKSVKGSNDNTKYGIVSLLGEGSSTYKGSAQSRVNNLILAAKRTNGVLVSPGETYSMNNSIGDISAETGYNTAYIIKGDRTVLGAGGGVCQTSTTLFRAVLNSGLPIVTRYPHAYRVSYYEQDMPVGFDAAIFQPSWDFQFKNDTSNYILVQSYPDPENYKLTFRIYGTPDGRTVEVSEPVISNQTPPPPALYQDDPTLPKGEVKQIDFAAWGANVKFTRTVKKGEEVLYEDVYSSRYQPWRAIYLVGTKK